MTADTLAKNFDAIFNPKAVAVIGASSTFGKWGQLILSNIIAGNFGGKIFPVNPKEKSISGLTAYSRLLDIPEKVDLAFIATPAGAIPGILEECGEKGVRGVVLITSGFSETDEAGKRLEKHITSMCREKSLALVGPNTMGIICPYAKLFATGSHTRPREGSVAFVSQSGNLGLQLIHWAEEQGIGVSLFVGSGNEAMFSCTDYLEYLKDDPRTRIIVLYMETVGEGRRFLDVVRKVHSKKPVIVLKGGRTEAGRTAAASHTGSMGGKQTIFRAACRQAGLLDVRFPTELLDLSAGFSSLPLPRGNRVGIVTLGGGWGVVTADECNLRGLVIPDIPESIIETIGRYLPQFWSKGNPVDLVGTRDLEVPIVAVEELLKWEGIDAVISLGIVGRLELVRSLIESTREVDATVSEEFLKQMSALSREYEKDYIAKIVELMETYEKPIIGVSLANTNEGTVRPVAGKRYSGLFYQTPENAVNVLARMVDYNRFVS
ncbi:MAG: CoA-binding protein [Deltaproteobacteria bacterium]|nr:CoA-binding protein [Deltaproteobacteria bacterium]MBW2616016.1 CoA-binding protein [Deltaproteobacteria bacterium]